MHHQGLELRHRASIVCVNDGRLLTVLLEMPNHGGIAHYLPGGKVEDGESYRETAVRETLEETGYQVAVDARHRWTAQYRFDWGDRQVVCHTVFYRAYLVSLERRPDACIQEDIQKGVEWISCDEALGKVGSHPVIAEALRRLMGPH